MNESLNSEDNRSYGGRGIDFDPRYESFDVFLVDVGEPSSPDLSIDRIDNNKGYWKDNIRWVTMREQYRNRRSNKFLSFGGKTLCLSDWAKELGLTPASLRKRINKHGISEVSFRTGAYR